jgi:hypothetical protein
MMSEKDEIRALAEWTRSSTTISAEHHSAYEVEAERVDEIEARIRALVEQEKEKEKDRAIFYLAWRELRPEERVRALEIGRDRLRQVLLIYLEYEPLINAKMRELIHRERGQ